MQTADFRFELPERLIAQEPLAERTASRMMVLMRKERRILHSHISELGRWLKAGDLLVFNDTRVIPARLFGRRKETGGRVELLLLEDHGEGMWEALFKAAGRGREGMVLDLADGNLQGTLVQMKEGGRVEVKLAPAESLLAILEKHGVPPLPPYIRRDRAGDPRTTSDRARYQTVYAQWPGAVAAPTAGLHFSEALLGQLEQQGIDRAFVTLHVGPGTFKPVKTDRVEDHVMEAERFEVGEVAAGKIRATKAAGGRVVAVGSTTVRTLETVAADHGPVVAAGGRSRIFIYPPFTFQVVDAMVTNFHLPQSTLLMMVSALAGREFVMDAYREAVKEAYRFYSYGDCMLIV